MLSDLFAMPYAARGVFTVFDGESGGFLGAITDGVISAFGAIGVSGLSPNTVNISIIALAAAVAVVLVRFVTKKFAKLFTTKRPERLAGQLIDRHLAFVQKFVDEMHVALNSGLEPISNSNGPMKFLMDECEETWEQIAHLGKKDATVERSLSSYLNSLKRLSVMEKAVMSRSDITSLDANDFEFQHPIAEAAAGLRVLARALGRTSNSKKDRLARYELTALSEDAEVVWDELKARASANELYPDIVLRSLEREGSQQTEPEFDNSPLPHVQEANPGSLQDELSSKRSSTRKTKGVESVAPVDGVVQNGALSGYEIADEDDSKGLGRLFRR